MLSKRRDAAMKVAKSLFSLEHAIDEALVQSAALNASIPIARTEANLSAVVGQEALDEAAAVFAALVLARRHVVGAHRKLDETKIQIGLRTVNFGYEDKGVSTGMQPAVNDEAQAA